MAITGTTVLVPYLLVKSLNRSSINSPHPLYIGGIQNSCWENFKLKFNSLAPVICGCNSELVIFKLISRIDIISMFCEIALRWMPLMMTSLKKTSNISHTKGQNLMILILSCSCLCAIHWSHVLNWEWRCSWSSTNWRCSNYIWVIKKGFF